MAVDCSRRPTSTICFVVLGPVGWLSGHDGIARQSEWPCEIMSTISPCRCVSSLKATTTRGRVLTTLLQECRECSVRALVLERRRVLNDAVLERTTAFPVLHGDDDDGDDDDDDDDEDDDDEHDLRRSPKTTTRRRKYDGQDIRNEQMVPFGVRYDDSCWALPFYVGFSILSIAFFFGFRTFACMSC